MKRNRFGLLLVCFALTASLLCGCGKEEKIEKPVKPEVKKEAKQNKKEVKNHSF